MLRALGRAGSSARRFGGTSAPPSPGCWQRPERWEWLSHARRESSPTARLTRFRCELRRPSALPAVARCARSSTPSVSRPVDRILRRSHDRLRCVTVLARLHAPALRSSADGPSSSPSPPSDPRPRAVQHPASSTSRSRRARARLDASAHHSASSAAPSSRLLLVHLAPSRPLTLPPPHSLLPSPSSPSSLSLLLPLLISPHDQGAIARTLPTLPISPEISCRNSE